MAMQRTIPLVTAFALILGLAAGADAAITMSSFSQPKDSGPTRPWDEFGLEVRFLGSGDLAQLTFVNQPIDASLLNGSPVADTSSDATPWDVIFGPLWVDLDSRTVNGDFAEWDLIVPPTADELLVQGPIAQLIGDITVGKLETKIGGLFGGMDSFGGLDPTTINAGSSAVFAEYASFSADNNLDWGFAYSGLNLDALLQAGTGSGFAGTTGYIRTPEPATIGLMVLGLGAMAFRRRRK
jgi:hypothetical protein